MAKRKVKPIVWCKPLVSAQRYDVVIASHETCPHLDESDEAATAWEDTTIAIRESLSDERKIDCLAHELFVHALLEATGLGRHFREKLDLTEKQWDDFEEECLARQFAPALLALLKTNGWLTLPKLPTRRTRAPKPNSAAKSRSAKKVK